MLVLFPLADVVLQQHLIVIIRALGLAIHAVANGKILLATFLAELRSERNAINAAATEAVLLLTLHAHNLGEIILQDGWQIYRCHNIILLGIHTHTCNALHIEDGDVECVLQGACTPLHTEDTLTDGVVLILQRAVQASIFVVEIEVAQVTQQTCYRTHDVTLHIGLDKHCGV